MRIAALDLGSNSFHLLVADVHPDGTFESIAREKDMLRLGDDVTTHGEISAAVADRAVASVRHLKQLADALGATEVLAKATSAIRSAANGPELVDRIEDEAGVEIEVISGLEEARLIFAAVRASVVLDPSPACSIDIGGGSVELGIGDAQGLRWAESMPLGVGRLTADFGHEDPPSKSDRRRLEEHIRELLEPCVEPVRDRAPGLFVGTSGTITDLARMAVALETGEVPSASNGLRVSREQFDALHERIIRTKTSERRKMPGLEEKRAELLPAGSSLLTIALEMFGADSLTVSDWAFREGIVLDAVRTHDPADWSDDPRQLRRAAVAGLARRCNSDEPHTFRVAHLALQLFDDLGPLHELGPEDREMLEFAALLHDIGQHVSRKGHHRHAAYLVEHGQLRGFEPSEMEFLSALVHHHRRGDPKPSEARFGALSAHDRVRVRKLAALLRVADGLDRGRRGVVSDAHASASADLVMVRLTAVGDPELALWGARRRRDLFETVFDRELELTISAAQNV